MGEPGDDFLLVGPPSSTVGSFLQYNTVPLPYGNSVGYEARVMGRIFISLDRYMLCWGLDMPGDSSLLPTIDVADGLAIVLSSAIPHTMINCSDDTSGWQNRKVVISKGLPSTGGGHNRAQYTSPASERLHRTRVS